MSQEFPTNVPPDLIYDSANVFVVCSQNGRVLVFVVATQQNTIHVSCMSSINLRNTRAKRPDYFWTTTDGWEFSAIWACACEHIHETSLHFPLKCTNVLASIVLRIITHYTHSVPFPTDHGQSTYNYFHLYVPLDMPERIPCPTCAAQEIRTNTSVPFGVQTMCFQSTQARDVSAESWRKNVRFI